MEKIKIIKTNELSLLPQKCGVYFFFGKNKALLYIGKASDLRDRAGTHFKQPNYRDNLFIDKVKKVGYIVLESEIEALIEEAKLIKKRQPKFNVLFRDDKNYFYVGITKEDWSRIFITHQPYLKTYKLKNLKTEYIGPFVGGGALKQTLKTLRKIFPYRTCKTLPKKPCLWHQIERCPAPCLIKKNSAFEKKVKEKKKEYKNNIRKLKLALKEGRRKTISELKKEMRKKSKSQEFEKAGEIRDKIKMLEDVFSHKFLFYPETKTKKENIGKLLKESLSLSKIPKRIEGYDISNIQEKEMVGSMTVLSRISANFETNSREYIFNKNEYRKFKIKTVKGQNDIACLKEVIKRRFGHPEWALPDLIFIDGGKGQLNAAKKALRQTAGDGKQTEIPIISLAKKENILYNSNLKKSLSLDNLPEKVKIIILRLKDESHKFAISYHRKLRSRKFIKLR